MILGVLSATFPYRVTEELPVIPEEAAHIVPKVVHANFDLTVEGSDYGDVLV